MNVERAVGQGPLRPIPPNQRDQDLAEALVESKTRYVPDPDDTPGIDDV